MRALRAVDSAEVRLGWTPERMEHNNPGFDVNSTDATGETVSIEVKGRIAGASTFFYMLVPPAGGRLPVNDEELADDLESNIGRRHATWLDGLAVAGLPR